MSRIEGITPRYVEFIPAALESGVLYISRKYKTATHLCCCGCGNKVVTPLKPGGWQLTDKAGEITLYPSIGSWNLPCQSHYWIRTNRVVLAPKWSKTQIEASRVSDRLERERHFDVPVDASFGSPWEKLLNWFMKVLRGH